MLLPGVAVLMLVVGLFVVKAEPGSATAATPTLSREALATTLLAHHRDRFATPALSRALRLAAGVQQSPGRALPGGAGGAGARAAGVAAVLPRARLANVRVNDPAADRFQVDQTTQSETSIAVSGSKVAVGFNDSQQALLALTDGLDFSGYAYSADGGKTFTDGGTLPNPGNFVNFGDPWLTADRAGRMYYSTLPFGGNVGNLEIGVARSGNGGKTWSEPRLASPNDDNLFYVGDKDAITAGRDPKVPGRDNLYVTWDDIAAESTGSASAGLAVATSIDHGASWSLHYADKNVTDPNSCSFVQYIGAQPLVDPANGTLYVAAEKIVVVDPKCTGGQSTFSEVTFTSQDGGLTFGRAVSIASITPATPTGALELGPGQFVRTAEFPTLALRGKTLWAAWNDGATGRSHIRLATSNTAGATWRVSAATRGGGDELQPALSVDAAGLHLAYYQRNANNSLHTVLADSTDSGIHFTATAVTTRSFPGVHTVPQFDPQIAFGYMGD
ncbi:sialidase family protein [Terrabacter sp. Ter38]|uniref:sialidase family protein n=1 Tax=Terrabacter sp. Ter38 TaxID=2926030 RepID=UPI00211851DB|nr:sialidase family protein [Terrabacter sp. Ter38]